MQAQRRSQLSSGFHTGRLFYSSPSLACQKQQSQDRETRQRISQTHGQTEKTLQKQPDMPRICEIRGVVNHVLDGQVRPMKQLSKVGEARRSITYPLARDDHGRVRPCGLCDVSLDLKRLKSDGHSPRLRMRMVFLRYGCTCAFAVS